MPKDMWIRTEWMENGVRKVGHAGRHGYIKPAEKGSGFKFSGYLYGDSQAVFMDDRVGELKKVLDVYESVS